MQSCTKLDKKVYSVVPQTDFFQTPAQISAGLAPAYAALTNIPDGNVFQINEISSDEIIVPTRGSDWYDNGKWQSFWKHEFKPDIGEFNDAWNDIFGGVGKVNFTLNVLNSLPSKPANLAAINAELKVLRAYYLFLGMDLFGNIPLVTDFNTDPSKVVTVPRATVYAFIESELKTNVPLLSPDNSKTNYGHINRYGGYMLLSKLYLNAAVYTGKQNWLGAQVYADSVINSGKYSLQPNYFDNFSVNNEASVENIFVVPFDKAYIGGNNMEMQTLNYQSGATFGLAGSPWNGFCSTSDYYSKFDKDDKRINMYLIGQQNDLSGKPIKGFVFSRYVNELSNPADSFKLAGVRNIKYHPEAGTAGSQSNDIVIFRLADAYLMSAEAQIEMGNMSGNAMNLVNAVRDRAYGDNMHHYAMMDMTLDNILNERARELDWEGWRRNDLIRNEIATGTKYYSGARVPGKKQDADNHTMMLPIPTPQLSSNPNLKQNPGY